MLMVLVEGGYQLSLADIDAARLFLERIAQVANSLR